MAIEHAARLAPFPLHICETWDEETRVVRKLLEGQESRGAYPPGKPTDQFFNALLLGKQHPVHLLRAPDGVFRQRARFLVLPASLTPDEYFQELERAPRDLPLLFTREEVHSP